MKSETISRAKCTDFSCLYFLPFFPGQKPRNQNITAILFYFMGVFISYCSSSIHGFSSGWSSNLAYVGQACSRNNAKKCLHNLFLKESVLFLRWTSPPKFITLLLHHLLISTEWFGCTSQVLVFTLACCWVISKCIRALICCNLAKDFWGRCSQCCITGWPLFIFLPYLKKKKSVFQFFMWKRITKYQSPGEVVLWFPCPDIYCKFVFNPDRRALRNKFFFGVSYLLGLMSLPTKCPDFSEIHS